LGAVLLASGYVNERGIWVLLGDVVMLVLGGCSGLGRYRMASERVVA